MTRRFYQTGSVIYLIAIALYSMLGLPFSLPPRQAPLAIALTAVLAAQHTWRVNRRDTFRRNHESLDGLPLTFGAFFLSPAWYILMAMVGPWIAWSVGTEHTARVRWLNASGQALTAVSCAYIYASIGPDGPLDSPKALIVVVGMWFATEAIRFTMVAVYVWARYERFNSPHPLARIRGIPYRGIPVMIGYSAAVAVEGAHWMIPAVLFAIALMYYLLINQSLSTARELLVGWLLGFFGRIDEAESAESVESALIDAFRQFAVLTTFGVATVTDDGKVAWTGDVAASIRTGLRSAERLEALCMRGPTNNPYWFGTIWVWPINQDRRSYMVATGVMNASGIADVTKNGRYLVESAQLGIATLRRRRHIEATAATEYERARTDALTGLGNRLAVIETVDSLIASHPDQQLVVFKTTIVGFRHTVDVLGSEVGDAVTVRMAQRLQNIASRHDSVRMVGRDDDDAFLLVAVGAEVKVDELAHTIASTADGSAAVTIARDMWVGAAIARPNHHVAAEHLVQRAGLARDRSERDGSAVIFGEVDAEREKRRISIRLRLPRAIDAGEVRPAFQPQVELATGRIVGCEVLARWDDHQIGEVSPGEFIEISEQSQQIELLTLSLLRQALELGLVDSTGHSVPLSLNLSARSMGKSTFVNSVMELIHNSDRSPTEFTFEVAESTLADDRIATAFGIDQLRSFGARVSIGNFGTGYSALSFLDQLPVHEIKIDRSLVCKIGTVDEPNPVIAQLIRLCDDLDLDVVAEGVETELEGHLLYELGCHRGQGYLITRPMLAADAVEWFRGQSRELVEAGSRA